MGGAVRCGAVRCVVYRRAGSAGAGGEVPWYLYGRYVRERPPLPPLVGMADPFGGFRVE
jgi:hypothetical protein